MVKKKIFTLALILLVSISFGGAEWWDGNWSFKKPIEITERNNTSLTNYSVELEIDTESLISSDKLQDDCSDLRFTNRWENRTIDHWVQSGCNTGSTEVYLEVPSIGNNESETLYMYYGNEEASSTSELTIGSSNNPAESCEQAYRKMENAPSRTFQVDPGEDGSMLQEVRCDMGVKDKGWTLLYNYDHAGGTTPDPTEGEWPLDHSALSHQDDIDDFGYTSAKIDSMRLRCETSNHPRIVHYVTKDSGAIQGMLDNSTKIGYQAVSNDAYKLPEHSAFLPDAAGSDTGESEPGVTLFGPAFPMYEGGEHHWSIGSPGFGGDRWECDDYPDGPQHDTLHQIWFNSDSDAPKLNRTPSKTILQETRQKKLVDRRTKLGKSPRTFFAENETVNLEVEGGYAEKPSISIFDPNGSEIVSTQMQNKSGVFEHNYTINGSEGWYRVEIGNFGWEKAFYRGEKWKDNFTDADGNIYTFRREINISEPGIKNRWNYPVDKHLDFNYNPERESVRVVSWNGSRMLEIPSQIYNSSQGEISSGNIVFLSSLETGEKRTYYVLSAKEDYSRNYSGLKVDENPGRVEVRNSFYNKTFEESKGGLLSSLRNKLGDNQEVQGVEPIDYYPELDIGLSSYSARVDSTSSINTEKGPLMTKVSVSGKLNDNERFPYSIECKAYLKNSYQICEKRLTSNSPGTDTWDSLIFNGLVVEDGRFTWAAYENSMGSVITEDLSKGSGSGLSFQDPHWISFHNNESGDALAEIFLERDFANSKNPGFSIQDSSSNDFFTQNVIDGGASVSKNEYFYTKTARTVYNGLKKTGKPENLYEGLSNPPGIQTGSEITNDDEAPFYINSGNISSNSTSNLTVFSRWEDDTFLQEYSINISGPGVEGDNTTLYSNSSVPIREEGSFTTSSWVNTTLNSSEFNSGKIYANFTVTDVSGKFNTSFFSFNVSDTAAPKFKKVQNDPSSNASVDPENEIEISANLTEYSSVADVNLYYRNSSTSNYTRKSMTEDSEAGFEKFYNTSITPEYEDKYTYLVEAEDSEGNTHNSSENVFYAVYDYTWSSNFRFENRTETFDKNTSTGNLTINNTGDFNLDFDFTTGAFNSRTWVNGSRLEDSYTVESGTSEFFTVNTRTRESGDTEGVDQIEFEVNADEGSPGTDFKIYEVVTSTEGPFLFTEFTKINETVQVGASGQKLEATITNKGSERAENVNMTFSLPEGWSSEDSLTSPTSLGLDVGSSYDHEISYDLADSVKPGKYSINVTSRSSNETESYRTEIEVIDTSDTIVEEGGSGGLGGAPSGPTSSEQVEQRSDQIFNTSESFEIVRGQDQNFTVRFQNPTRFNLTNITANVEGIQSQYLQLANPDLGSVNINESKNITVQITAPEYFQTGDYDLNFNITGKGIDGEGPYADYFGFTLNKDISLGVRAIPRDNASELLNQSEQLVQEMSNENLSTADLQGLVSEAEDNLESGDYASVRENYEELQSSYQTAQETREGLRELEKQINSAEASGLSVGRTRQIASLAEAALDRGAYATAADRLEEAESTYQLQTAGEVNWVYEIRSNWKKILAAIIIFSIVAFAAKLRYRLYRIRKRLRDLESEEKSIEDLKIQKQKKAFEEKEISLSEYEDSVEDYNEQIVQIIEERVELETEKANITNFKKRDSLAQERDQLKNLIEETQRDYLEGNISDNEIYQEKVEELTERLSEIEGEIAEIDAKAQVRSESYFGRFLERTPLVSSGGKLE